MVHRLCRIRREMGNKSMRLRVVQNELADAEKRNREVQAEVRAAQETAARLARQEADTELQCAASLLLQYLDIISCPRGLTAAAWPGSFLPLPKPLPKLPSSRPLPKL